MKIEKVDYCFDGGSALITTDTGNYFINRSIGSKPDEYMSIYSDEHRKTKLNHLKVEMIEALSRFSDPIFSEATAELIDEFDNPKKSRDS